MFCTSVVSFFYSRLHLHTFTTVPKLSPATSDATAYRYNSYTIHDILFLLQQQACIVTRDDGSRMSIAIMRLYNAVCLCALCLSVRTIKPKRLKSKITKLGTRIVHHDTSPNNEYLVKGQRSKVKVRVRRSSGLFGQSYAPLSSASLVYKAISPIFSIFPHAMLIKHWD